MKNIISRIKAKRDELHLSQQKLADIIGWPQSRLGNYESGARNIPDKAISELAKALGVSDVWLRYGDGTSVGDTITTTTTNHYYEHSSGNDFQQSGSNIAAVGNVESFDREEQYSDLVNIPFYDIKLSAGEGNLIEWIPSEFGEPLRLPSSFFKMKRINPNACKAMIVRGRSMYPVLDDLDAVVVVDEGSDVIDLIDGEIYAVIFKGRFFIKQILRSRDGIILYSYNADEFPQIEIPDTEYQYLKILGRKVWRGG